MKNEITLNAPEMNGVEKSKAEQIKNTFVPMAEMLSRFDDRFAEIMNQKKEGFTEELSADAKRLRIDISKIRIETEKTRKAQKEEYLRAGKAIDGVANILKWAVSEKENQLKEIEDHFEIQRQKELDALQEKRAEELSKYVDQLPEIDLASMDKDVWLAYLSTKKRDHEDRIAAQKKAEEEKLEFERLEKLHRTRKDSLVNDRLWQFREDWLDSEHLGEIGEEKFDELVSALKKCRDEYDAEQERIREENERLKKEAEEREKREIAEAKKRMAEEEARKKKEEAERKAAEAKLKKEREERQRIEREERAKREKLEAELKAKEEAERKAKEEEEARVQAELNKGDRERVLDMISDFELIKSKYSFKSAKNKKIKSSVDELIEKTIKFIKDAN